MQSDTETAQPISGAETAMNQVPKPDKSNRMILVGLMILAAVTIGGTIISTTMEWDVRETETAAQDSQ